MPRWPKRYGDVPLPADCFQPRVEGSRLAELLADGHSVVLAGPGGAGKTQLAADHVRRVSGDLDLLVWVSATSREAVVAAFAAVYAGLTGFGGGADVAAQRFLSWLANAPQRRLVILDDVRSLADLAGLWPPGPVLATTRERDAAALGERRVLEVGRFGVEEAGAYLAARFGADPCLLTGTAGLAEDLGRWPLALALAGAIGLEREPGRAARELIRGRHREPSPERGELPDASAAVGMTWAFSVEWADRLEPLGLARPLLALVSLLEPNGVPEQLITGPVVLGWLGAVTGQAVDADQVRAAVRGLHRLSLLAQDPGSPDRVIRVSGLVQRVVREDLGERLGAVAKVAADALYDLWPAAEQDGPLVRALRANTAALRRHLDGQGWVAGHPLLFRAGNSLGESGQAAAAVRYFADLCALTERSVGARNPGTLTARHDRAYWCGEAGEVATAVRELERVCADQTGVLGPRHPHTLTTRHNLARWRGQAGRHARIVAELAAVLDDQLAVLGPRHPHTLTTRHDLARWRGATGDAATAVTELEQLLRDQIFALGPWHPNTLTTRHNLARWRGHAGDAEAAVTELARVLDDQVRELGPWHPNILITCHNLVHWRMVLDGAATP
ncbi:tetratricopeptide repeat protein [Crossiella sp. CA198]|uniref:tetratricopeptide repeat protein n=1 Tax=Crossiella sp. CA198 TaxID=3455607 RepID=UPI003F8D827F